MPLGTSAASKSSIFPRACPDSARAIIKSALKVRIRPSDSSIVRSSAARYSASLLAFASASSARLRSRVEPPPVGVGFFPQPIQLIAATPHREPSRKIAGHDALGGAGHGVDTAK